ncbi:MAG: response regulator [Phycisphaerales bacterium]|nr:response regulator [Phycisphaerales bacterium]
MKKDQPFHHGLLQLIKAVGVWTSGFLMLGMVIFVISYIRVGSITNTEAVKLVELSAGQQMLIEKMAKGALEIKVAINTDDWDAVKVSLKQITIDHQLWNEAYLALQNNRHNSLSGDEGSPTVQDYFDRIHYSHSQVSQALDEIELVGRSVIRRAPYIDQSTHDRIIVATDIIIMHEPGYLKSMNEIVSLYVLNASTSSSGAIASVRKSLWLLLATLTVAFLIGVIPRYWLLTSQSSRLQDSLTRANGSVNSRWHFLASLGHEFRTPMSSIMGFAGLLASEDQDKITREEHANKILVSSRGLMSLIEDIIDMSAIEAGQLTISPGVTTPRTIIDQLKCVFTPLAQEKGLEFNVFIDSTCPASVTIDEKRLKQIISKVIENAIKFTQTGSVELHAALEEINGKSMFVVRVVDTGIGIDFNDVSRIFEPFERIENGMNRAQGGAGLGLTVAHALARQLGGDITIKTAKGVGCFVTISVNPGQYTVQSESDPVATIQKIVADREVLESKLVLLIEDGEDNQRLISHHLTKAGCRIQLAENGQIGIDRYLAALESVQPIDLILMDMQMPVMDGFEATSILRQKGAKIPIIGVTAHSSADDRTRCFKAGCDEYLIKPVDKALLLDTCAIWISKHAASETGESDETSESLPPQAA